MKVDIRCLSRHFLCNINFVHERFKHCIATFNDKYDMSSCRLNNIYYLHGYMLVKYNISLFFNQLSNEAFQRRIWILILSLNFVISAQRFGLPYLSPYLDSMGSNFSRGANFATAGSTIRFQQAGGQIRSSPFSLGIQYQQFERFKPTTKLIRDQGINNFNEEFWS